LQQQNILQNTMTTTDLQPTTPAEKVKFKTSESYKKVGNGISEKSLSFFRSKNVELHLRRLASGTEDVSTCLAGILRTFENMEVTS